MTKEEKLKSDRAKSYYIFEEQMKEDIMDVLNRETAEGMLLQIRIIKRIGSILLREGFRLLLWEEHKRDINDFINSYRVLISLVFYHEEWVTNSLKFVILGVKDPLVFLCQAYDKLLIIEKMK